MRGTKRKRDIFTLAELVDNWFVASGSAVDLPEMEEGGIVQGHATTFGEGSNYPHTNQVKPVGCHVGEGANRWLGLRPTIPSQLDGSGRGGTGVLANQPSPGGCHVAKQDIDNGGGLVLVGADTLGQGETSNAHTSLAKEAVTWLEARDTPTGRPEGDNQGVSAETNGPGPPTVGPIIEEKDLTLEDFWSLLRDTGYEVW